MGRYLGRAVVKYSNTASYLGIEFELNVVGGLASVILEQPDGGWLQVNKVMDRGSIVLPCGYHIGGILDSILNNDLREKLEVLLFLKE